MTTWRNSSAMKTTLLRPCGSCGQYDNGLDRFQWSTYAEDQFDRRAPQDRQNDGIWKDFVTALQRLFLTDAVEDHGLLDRNLRDVGWILQAIYQNGQAWMNAARDVVGSALYTVKKKIGCARCKGIAYCGKKHQVHDWPTHKQFCKKYNGRGSNVWVFGLKSERNTLAKGGLILNMNRHLRECFVLLLTVLNLLRGKEMTYRAT